MKDKILFSRNPQSAAGNELRQSLKPGKRSGSGGFTMGEMVIVIAIIAILAALITPLAVDQILQGRYDACREELDVIKKAIVGDPTLVEGGVRSSFGFVGDVGAIPNNLQELVTWDAARPAYEQYGSTGMFYGWRGPYVSDTNDPWGRPYSYFFTGTTIASDNTRVWIWSVGPDGIDNSMDDVNPGISGDGNYGDDSVIVRITQDEMFSMVSGNTLDETMVSVTYTAIQIDFPNGARDDGDQSNEVYSHSLVSAPAINYLNPPVYVSTVFIPIGIRRIQYTTDDGTNGQRLIYINNGPMTVVNLVDPLN